MFILLIASALACDFTKDDHYYNLTSLHQSTPYTVKVSADSSFFKMAYQFNFCDDHPKHCQNTPAAYEMIEVLGMMTDSCEMIGKPDEQIITQIENGLQITYSSGSNCENNQKRSVNYKVYCNSQVDSNFKLEQSDKCSTNFSIKSPAGCKIQIEHPNYLVFGLVGLGVVVMALSIWLTIKFKMGKDKKDEPTDYEKIKDPEPLKLADVEEA